VFLKWPVGSIPPAGTNSVKKVTQLFRPHAALLLSLPSTILVNLRMELQTESDGGQILSPSALSYFSQQSSNLGFPLPSWMVTTQTVALRSSRNPRWSLTFCSANIRSISGDLLGRYLCSTHVIA
jgi:hypothetical protein